MEENQITPTEVDSETLLEEFTRQATQEILLENTSSELKTKVVETLKPILEPDSLVEEDATAAGLDAGDAGHSFVDLIRIVENVPNASYGFPANPTLSPPEIKGESFSIETQSVFTKTEPETPTTETPNGPNPSSEESKPEVPAQPEIPKDPESPVKGNNGWGNGDQEAPGNSGPHNNAENNTSEKEDPSHGSNSDSSNNSSSSNSHSTSPIESVDDTPTLGSLSSSSSTSSPISNNTSPNKGNNGWGNGDQTAPGNSGTNNNAENNTSGKQSPLSKKDVLADDLAELMFGGSLMPEDLVAATELITQITRHVNHP